MKKTQILSLVVILVLALTVVLAACQPAAPAGDALEEVKTAGKTEIDNYAKILHSLITLQMAGLLFRRQLQTVKQQ